MIKQVVQSKDDGGAKSETGATELASSTSAWKRDSESENSDALVRLMRDQLIMARAYANIAQGQGHFDLVRDLKLRIKEHTSIVGDANLDAELPAGYFLGPVLLVIQPMLWLLLCSWTGREQGLECYVEWSGVEWRRDCLEALHV